MFGKKPQRKTRKTSTASKIRKANRGLRSLTKLVKGITKPYHAKGAKRGMKFW